MKQMIRIGVDEELYELDLQTLRIKGLMNDQNLFEAYIKNMVMYGYTVDE